MPDARPHCYRCDKVQSMCVCATLRPLPNTVGVHVLQHPAERRHPLGTVRLLRLGLASVHVHVLALEGKSATSPPVALPEGVGLLYPGPEARDLGTLSEEDQPDHLVVIDGTWAQAHRIFRDTPWISQLPCYRLATEQSGRYRIRAEPRAECLSTVESVVAALRCLQPDLPGIEMLDSAFDAMIDAQVAARDRSPSQARWRRPRKQAPRPIPEVLLAPDTRVVVVYAEAAPGEGESQSPLRLAAACLDGPQTFDGLIETPTLPAPHHADHMGIGLHEFQAAQPLHEVLAGFRAFCDSAPNERSSEGGPLVLVCWNPRTHRWLGAALGDTTGVLLKGVWANLSRERVPALDVLVASLGLETESRQVTGRAGRRLGDALAMARHMLRGVSPVA